ncbi:MAG: hypothetical protein KGH72_03325 [Candidatus Micrarchaeota archaeon]|nr:hypothetical protein [Candidatus Micrarchaeota archaeon]
MPQYGLEIDEREAKEIAGAGAKVFVFWNSQHDLEYVEQVLGARPGNVEGMDIEAARRIVMGGEAASEVRKIGSRFDGAVIVCPHGNTSRRFAEALSAAGIKSYSLRRGLEGLRGRA